MKYKLSDDGKRLIVVDKDIISLVLPDSVEIIGKVALMDNKNLKYLEGHNITNIQLYAFFNSSLKCIDLPNIKEITFQTFTNSTLETINIPNCIKIGSFALYNCNSLYNINSKLSKEQLIPAFGSEEQYQQYLERRRDYKLNRLINEI